MNTSIVQAPEAVHHRLDELGFPATACQETIDAMVAAQRSWTTNDVMGAGGTRAYLDGTRRARDVGQSFGWEVNREAGLEAISHPELKIRIAVCNSTANACFVDSAPSNRNPKGPATEVVIARNNEQLQFMDLLEEASIDKFKPGGTDGFTTWYLFVYATADTYKAELSCPLQVEGGHFGKFAQRIFLVRDGDNDNNLQIRTPLAPCPEHAFDVIVTRKHA